MNFSLSDDHLLLRESAQRFLSAEVNLSRLLQPGADVGAVDQRALWRQMAQLGWSGLLVSPEHGGLGMDLVDLVMVVRECGRHLATAPLFGTLAGTWALQAAGSPAQQQALLPRVADGSLTLAIGMADAAGECETGNTGVTATERGDATVRLDGTAHYVVDGALAGGYVVAAQLDGQARWCFVAREQAGIRAERIAWRDITREVCHLHVGGAAAQLLPRTHAQAWSWLRSRLWLLLAAESAGGLQAVLDDTVAYAKERVAFGKPIGGYQAIKHGLADMLAQSECAATAVLYAAWVLSQVDHADALTAPAMAQALASEAYRDATHRSIQVFGAIGFTWEMKNHLHYKRARANAALLGSPAWQREVIARALQARHEAVPS